eukprot:Colp12_sorted_trinity150504_noHs@28381
MYIHYSAITSYESFDGTFSFYNAFGELNTDAIFAAIKKRKETLLGWFRFRRNTQLGPTARENMIHRALQDLMRNLTTCPLLFTMFTSSVTENSATHTYDYRTVILDAPESRDAKYVGMNMEILNIQQGSHAEYINLEVSTAVALPEISKTCLSKMGRTKEADAVEDMCTELLGRLKTLCGEVALSESRLKQVHARVCALKGSNEASQGSPMVDVDMEPKDGFLIDLS